MLGASARAGDERECVDPPFHVPNAAGPVRCESAIGRVRPIQESLEGEADQASPPLGASEMSINGDMSAK